MRQNFEPKIWGPHAWFFLETITMSYPENPSEEQIKNFKTFFYTLQFIIPCNKCRVNYNKHLQIYPLSDHVLRNRDNLFKWIVNMHNAVDPNKTRTLKETYDYYISQYSGEESSKINNKYCTSKLKNIFIVSSIILSIICIHKIYNFLTAK